MNAGRKTALVLILVLIATAASNAAVPVTPADQPLMQAARADLQRAEASLKRAKDNRGGHRTKAISLIQAAINEVNLGAQFDRNNSHGILTAADQPNMQAALVHLQTAKTKLEDASDDKGGHRRNAIGFVNKAINEVNEAIAAAN